MPPRKKIVGTEMASVEKAHSQIVSGQGSIPTAGTSKTEAVDRRAPPDFFSDELAEAGRQDLRQRYNLTIYGQDDWKREADEFFVNARDARGESPNSNLEKNGWQDIAVSIVRITPDIAKQYLSLAWQNADPKKAPYRNRSAIVSALAQQMAQQHWLINGVPISWSKSFRLLDGHSRLQACVEAGKPFLTLLAQNLDDDASATIDQHAKRNWAATLRGVRHATAIQTALTKLIRIDQGTIAAAGPESADWDLLDRYWTTNSDLLRSAAAHGLAERSGLLADTVRIPLAFMSLRIGRIDAYDKLIGSIVRDDSGEPHEPGRVLRRQLDWLHRRRTPASTLEALAWGMQALDDIVNDRKAEGYDWSPGRTEPNQNVPADPWPRLTGYQGLIPPAIQREQLPIVIAADVDPALHLRIHSDIEIVGSEKAAEWLKRNRANRNIQPANVERLRRDIEGGLYHFNPMPIVFDSDGNLLNGQHRLTAVKAAQRAVPFLVVRGVDPKAYATFDTSARRPVTLDLEAAGGYEGTSNDPELVTAIAQEYWRWKLATALAAKRAGGGENAGSTRLPRPSVSEIQRIVKEQPRIAAARFWARKLKVLGRPAVMGFLAVDLAEAAEQVGVPVERAEEFLIALATGEGIERGSPIADLRDRLLRARATKSMRDRYEPMREIQAVFRQHVVGEGEVAEEQPKRRGRRRRNAEAS